LANTFTVSGDVCKYIEVYCKKDLPEPSLRLKKAHEHILKYLWKTGGYDFGKLLPVNAKLLNIEAGYLEVPQST